MPKETIDSRYEGLQHPGGEVAHEPKATIGWSKGLAHVELGVTKLPLDGDVENPHSEQWGWYMQLDRAGINRMIHALRTARDQAFGKDA